MGANYQKTPLARALRSGAEVASNDLVSLLGKGLPCSVESVDGAIVTVKFELTNIPFTIPNVTMAVAGSEYIREPIQKGCKGVALPASARLGGMNGLGVGTANLVTPANLAALTFFPIGNKGWAAPESANKIEIWGPDGVIIRSANKKARLDLTDDTTSLKFGDNASVTMNATGLTLTFGTNSIVIDAAGIHINGPVVGNVTGAGGVINFGGTNLTTTGNVEGGHVKAGAIDLAGHHHTAQGATAPTTAAQP